MSNYQCRRKPKHRLQAVYLDKVVADQAYRGKCSCGWKTSNIYSSKEMAAKVYYKFHKKTSNAMAAHRAYVHIISFWDGVANHE